MQLWRHITRQRWAKVAVGVAAAEYLRLVGRTSSSITLEPADIYERSEADTEELRKAVVHYRVLLDEILEVRAA